jgi:hypothetical protein
MTKRGSQDTGETAGSVKETWEEFKDRTGKAAESVIDEVTDPEQLQARAEQAAGKVKSFYRSYRTYLIGAAVLLAAAGLYAALKPASKRKSWLPF